MTDPTTMALALLVAGFAGWLAGARWAERRLMRHLAELCRRPGPVTRDVRPPTPREREMHWRGAYSAVPVEDQIADFESRHAPAAPTSCAVEQPSARLAATAPDGGTHQPAADHHGGYVNRAPAAGCDAGISPTALTEEPAR